MPVDVRDLDCDFYVFTGHKVYGPSGIGVLYGKKDRLKAMRPFQGGGEMIVEVTRTTSPTTTPPHRFEAGTPPIVQAIGLGAALDYMDSRRARARLPRTRPISSLCAARLRKINSLRIFGDAPDKGAIISFELEGIHAHDVSMVIDRAGVAVRAGTHCAQPLDAAFRRDLHLPGLVRHVQYAGRGRCSGRCVGKGAKVLRVSTEMDDHDSHPN